MNNTKMRNLLGLIIALICLAGMLAPAHAITPPGAVPQPAAASAPKVIAGDSHRIALVIGNSAYTNSPLKNPVNDAKDIATKLRGLGFEVIERNNLQTRQIGGTLREFRSKLTPGAVALVFYAGHGLQIKGDNYLPAVDAEINSEEDVPNQSLAVRQIMDVLDEAKTRLNLVFLDACRNNPYARSFRSADRGLARISAPSGTLISYATRPGSVAADGDGRNGLYTSKLLAQMDSNIQIEQTLKRVVTEVKAASQGKQEPWMEGSIEGDFCFAGCAASGGGTQPLPVPVRVKGREEIEQETWESARDSAKIGAIQEYVKQYPTGRFVGQARVLIATLKAEPAKPAEPVVSSSARSDPETALWNEVKTTHTLDDYQTYLTQYPKGKYVALAKSRIKKVKEEAANEGARKEQQAWQAAEQAGSETDYQGYLNAYPQGKYAGLAQIKIRKLKNDIAAREEQAQWQTVQSSEDAKVVLSYLDKYPNSSHLAAAQDKLAVIKKAEASGPKAGAIIRDCPDCPEMVVIPKGSFDMGETGKTHRVTLAKPFAIGKTEVTQSQWKAVMGSNPSHFSNCGDTCPVEKVSWDDAKEFIQKLNSKTGKQYRLPSEAEWEYACRAGGRHEYCGSDDVNSVAWYGFYATPKGNSGETTNPVATKQANAFGLYDMSGNVWEWVEDSYHDNYSGAPADGSAWPGDGAKRVLRGGSWYNGPQVARAAVRYWFEPAFWYFSFGFRLARMLP